MSSFYARKARRISSSTGRGREEEEEEEGTMDASEYPLERELTQEELEAKEVERKRVQAQEQGPDRPFKCDMCAQSFVSLVLLLSSRGSRSLSVATSFLLERAAASFELRARSWERRETDPNFDLWWAAEPKPRSQTTQADPSRPQAVQVRKM